MRNIFFLVLFLFALSRNKAQPSVFTVTLKTTAVACNPGTAHVTISGGTGPLSVTWSTGENGVWATNLDSGLYSVYIADTVGNDSLIYFYIDMHHCGIVAAQSFSPNGDGINDYWTAGGAQNYSEFLIQIFNRWGQKVHEIKNEYKEWDGKSFGLPVPDGTYYYIIEYTDPHYGKQMDKGSITIIR